MLLPPFVLTHTMDVLFRNGQAASSSREGTRTQLRLLDYKASVVHEDPAMRWKSLLSMGRPLWNTYIQREVSLESQQTRISTLATSKLLLGQPDYVRDSYNEGTMFGIAALLCRLGLRPHSSSSLSTRVVADFMGVLNYVSFTNDSHITSYPSEPILAFGAARVWYQLQPDTALEQIILPRFQEMLMQRVVDIGDVGEVVARIFLLLAMDETVARMFLLLEMDETVAPSPINKRDFIFAGQLCSVKKFLDLLIGTSAVVKMDGGSDVTEKQQTEYEAWIESWGDWQMSFSQFEDLSEEPTAEMLWLMLARRAAGVLRRNQRGADLVIPMFHGDAISCILVQVKNREKDDEYPASAATKLLPANVFEETNPLSALHAREMIRLSISLREEEMPAQFVVLTTKEKAQQDSAAQSSSYVLCLRGVCKRWQDGERPWSFLSKGVSMQLSEIANSAWWDISARAQSDLKARAASTYSELSGVLPAEELVESVEFSLPFSRYSKELQRWKQQQSEMGKRKSGNGKPKRSKGKRKKSRC